MGLELIVVIIASILCLVFYLYFDRKLRKVREQVRSEIFDVVKAEADKANADLFLEIEDKMQDIVKIDEERAEAIIKLKALKDQISTFESERRKYGEALELSDLVDAQKTS